MIAPDHYITYLRDISVSASIGIHAFEQTARQPLLVSVALFLRRPDEARDDIATVQDYDFVRERLTGLVAKRHFNLQETLCRELLAICLEQERVAGAVVRTEKPAVYPDTRGVGCVLAGFKDPALAVQPWLAALPL